MAVFLSVLRIIGIVLLCILAAILLMILLVLFVPFRYRVDAGKEDKLHARARVHWLLYFVIVDLLYDDGINMRLKILGIPFYGHGDGKNFDDYIDFRDFHYNPEKYSLRWDSTAQVLHYTRFADDAAVAELIEGLLARQAACIALDPYANAFNETPSGRHWDSNDLPEPDHRVVHAVRRNEPDSEDERGKNEESRRGDANGFPVEDCTETNPHFTSKTSCPAGGMNVPFISGSYMASAWSEGTANLPGVTARTV